MDAPLSLLLVFGDLDLMLTMAGVGRQTGMVMIAETISLGILSLPAALSVLGVVPYVYLPYISTLRLNLR